MKTKGEWNNKKKIVDVRIWGWVSGELYSIRHGSRFLISDTIFGLFRPLGMDVKNHRWLQGPSPGRRRCYTGNGKCEVPCGVMQIGVR